jgi:hypothetical protein
VHDSVLLSEGQNEHSCQDGHAIEVFDDQATNLVGVVESLENAEEVDHFVETLEEQEGANEDFKQAVGLELILHFNAVQDEEQQELGAVDDVPEIHEVLKFLISDLEALKDDEPDLGEETDVVQDVQEECELTAEGEDEGH